MRISVITDKLTDRTLTYKNVKEQQRTTDKLTDKYFTYKMGKMEDKKNQIKQKN